MAPKESGGRYTTSNKQTTIYRCFASYLKPRSQCTCRCKGDVKRKKNLVIRYAFTAYVFHMLFPLSIHSLWFHPLQNFQLHKTLRTDEISNMFSQMFANFVHSWTEGMEPLWMFARPLYPFCKPFVSVGHWDRGISEAPKLSRIKSNQICYQRIFI